MKIDLFCYFYPYRSGVSMCLFVCVCYVCVHTKQGPIRLGASSKLASPRSLLNPPPPPPPCSLLPLPPTVSDEKSQIAIEILNIYDIRYTTFLDIGRRH